MAYSKYDKPYGQHFIEFISKDQAVLAGNEKVRSKLNFIGLQIDLITDLVYEYTNSANVSLDTDDEIINWTFPDVNSDLIGAAWNLNSNLYKITGVCLRNAYEMSFVALYFQIRQNKEMANGQTGPYNNFFYEWDKGERDTPGWRETKPIVNQNEQIKNYNSENNCDIIEEVYSWFKYLCNFTHGRPFNISLEIPESEATNHMNIGDGYNEKNFERFYEHILDTISWMATCWSLSFPSILIDAKKNEEYKSLFRGPRAIDVYNYISKVNSIT